MCGANPGDRQHGVDALFEPWPLDCLAPACSSLAGCSPTGPPVNQRFSRVKAFDRLVLENAKEMWTEVPKASKGQKKAKPINKDRFMSKVFIRGDSVILVLRNPL